MDTTVSLFLEWVELPEEFPARPILEAHHKTSSAPTHKFFWFGEVKNYYKGFQTEEDGCAGVFFERKTLFFSTHTEIWIPQCQMTKLIISMETTLICAGYFHVNFC